MTTVALGHTHAVQKLPQQTNSLNVLVGGGGAVAGVQLEVRMGDSPPGTTQ